MDGKASLKIQVCVLLVLLAAGCFSFECFANTKFTVVIDAGHGGRDSGAPGSKIKEKQINLAVALKLGTLISTRFEDVKVIYTRKTDRFIDLDERAEIANRAKADLFISIHTNAVEKGSSARGTETYTLGLARTQENLEVAMRENSAILLEDNYLQKYEGFDPQSSESYIIFEFIQSKHVEQSVGLASEIQKAFRTAGRVNRGVHQSGFLVLRKTSMPSVLVELGFISNKNEEIFMSSAAGQAKLAQSICDAFGKYKKEYDRKRGLLSAPGGPEKREVRRQPPVTTVTETKPSRVTPSQNAGKVVYKVQILTSERKLPAGSRLLKGYKPVDCYRENGLYKYTYGESTSFDAIKKVRKQLLKDFKDAFIVAFKDGKKVKY